MLTPEEGRALFDRRAREEMGMSGEEFLRRWHAGEFRGQDEPGIISMMMLLPFMEQNGRSKPLVMLLRAFSHP